jgi:hypothetical protein
MIGVDIVKSTNTHVLVELRHFSSRALPAIDRDLRNDAAHDKFWKELALNNPPLARFLIARGNQLDMHEAASSHKLTYIRGVIDTLRLLQRAELTRHLSTTLVP